MQYTHGQKVAQAIWALNDKSELASDLKFAAPRHLDESLFYSKSNGDWNPCARPVVTDFNHWNHGHDSGSGRNGGRRIWRWIQIKTENWIYCLTETRQPIDNNPANQWETVNACSRKPLILTPAAIEFFTEAENLVALNFEED